MSVLGFDIGNENSYIAVARAGGIETIANEYSQRSTPTYVAFGDKARDLGVSAKNKHITNVKNTVFNFKRLIGLPFVDAIVEEERPFVSYGLKGLPNDQIGIEVTYLNEKTMFSVQQVYAMFLTKLKEISESNLKIKVADCVIAVPVYYSDFERRAVLDAAQIAGLNVLRLMNEPTAVALAYGFYQKDLSEDKPRNVAFVDMGSSSLQVTVCAFTKGKLKILGSVWNRNLGGRYLDSVLVEHFVKEFNEKYKLNIKKNARAYMRLMQECEKLKKQMSAYSLELPLNIECLMDDKDVSGRMNRERFEELAAKHFQSIEGLFQKLFTTFDIKPEDIESVQIVGGSTRVPAVKSLIQKVFGKEPSTTLNQDEAVARGCALQCAMLSPTFKTQDFSITDIQPYPIRVSWCEGEHNDNKSVKTYESIMEVFQSFHPVPCSKKLTLGTKKLAEEPFLLEAFHPPPGYINLKAIGKYHVQSVSGPAEKLILKFKARVNIHGIFSIYSASMLVPTSNGTENDQKSLTNSPKTEEAMESEQSVPENGEVNSNEVNEVKSEEGEKKESEQKKPKFKIVELPMKTEYPQLTPEELNDFIEKESKMIMQDKMEKEKADAKNAVEEYVYEIRNSLNEDGVLAKFVSQEESNKFKAYLDETENWLYDEGEDQQKSVYVQRLNDLKKYGDPIQFRAKEANARPTALNEFGRSLQLVNKACDSYKAKDEQYIHLEEEEIEKVHKLWQEKQNLFMKYMTTASQLKPTEHPPFTVAEIRRERENFEAQVKPILTKPKPKVEPPSDKKEAESTQASVDSEMKDPCDSQETSKPGGKTGESGGQEPPENMETN